MHQSINDIRDKIKRIINLIERQDIFFACLILLVGLGSFGLGRLSIIEGNKTPLKIDYLEFQQANLGAVSGKYVASKSGTKYHLPWCSGAQRISKKNKIWFNTKEEAESKGYTPANNCKGI